MPSKLLLVLLASLALPLAAQQQAPAANKTDSQATAEASASPAAGDATTLDTIMVYGESENDSVIQNPFLMPVEGTKIFAGKRATIIDLDAQPKIQANNYRQALALTPGLLFSEETTPLVSIGYRGIGEPHRMQYMQVLKDGIPIHADPFGYPEAYYTPPLDVVDRIEFVRGGSSLMYGAQPAGALNYITYMPDRNTPFSFRTQNIMGSDDLFLNYTAATGTLGPVGYYGYFNRRESDGFREANSEYHLTGGHLKLSWDVDADTRWILSVDGYEEQHGEPGGLTARDFARNPDKTTRFHDEFRLRRYAGSLELQHRFSSKTELSIKTWGGYYQRWSKRQRGGGFGTLPVDNPLTPLVDESAANNIENQEFYTFGIEPRLRHDWNAWGGSHTLAAGMQFYYNHSPREDQRGGSRDSDSGTTTAYSERDLTYGSLFLENKFSFGRLSITPGFRMELINQDITTQNYSATTGLPTTGRSKSKFDPQPLFGLGIAYDLDHETQLYANVSQSYRTTIFTESLVVPTNTDTFASDAEPNSGWSYEVGYRGQPSPWINWDTSLFLIDLDNKFGGTIDQGTTLVLRNVGRTINYGWDGAFQLDLIGAYDALTGGDNVSRLGSLSLYGNATLLEAKIHGGASDGKTPQYAPDYVLRTGLMYKFKDRVKVSFLGTFVGDHYATDDENPDRHIPAYMTWDLTAEVKVTKNFTAMAGLNNVFDESYYSRVRSDGIDPGYGRNFYVGGSIQF
jgi:Fe(3+) dicitrate transport protein